ncbi:MAG: phosphate signaling complex protein PhoU [Candidatus Omnitrophota bacterium]|nr:phosphate signaling complex protein PhoU [Candidatus Omnitrophota bacterium]
MERYFDQELAALKSEILRMSSLVEAAIIRSVESLKKLDALEADSVITADENIDELELQIDERCLDLLALRQPMAHDLRFIAMAMKITTDLERMADLAVDIAQRVLEMSGKPLLKPLVDIPKLAVLAQKMVKKAIDAFIDEDTPSAGQIIILDAQADKLRNLVQRELIDDYILKDPLSAARAISLLLAARHLERICDHATNIAEDVIYMAQATVVKHHPEKLEEGKG